MEIPHGKAQETIKSRDGSSANELDDLGNGGFGDGSGGLHFVESGNELCFFLDRNMGFPFEQDFLDGLENESGIAMGLFVCLYVQSEQIPAAEWHQIFDESLDLLQSFPVPLVGLEWEETTHGKRAMFSPFRLREDTTHGKHWRVEGDAISGERGETFLLRRGLCERSTKVKASAVRDVLWSDKENLDFVSGNGKTVFDSKTQEYPYHYAMLAVGMLVESRFPGRAFVIGDITPEQAQHVIEWTNRVLKTPLNLPVVMDGERLWKRLTKAYDADMDSAVNRFNTLYRGAFSALEALIRCRLAPEFIERFIEQRLNSYSSLTQIGAGRVVVPLIETLGLDVALNMIGRINQRRNEEKRFDFTSLAESLAEKFITFSPEERAPILGLHPEHASLMNIEETVFGVLSRFTGRAAPDLIACHVGRDELLAAFRPFVSTPPGEFEQSVDKVIEECAKELELARQASTSSQAKDRPVTTAPSGRKTGTSPSLDDRPVTTAPSGRKTGTSPSLDDSLADGAGNAMPSDFSELIRWEAQRQCIMRMNVDEWAETMASIRGAIQSVKEKKAGAATIAATQDRNLVLDKLYHFVDANGFAPLESTWRLIDSENLELEQLKALCILAMFKWDRFDLSNMRRYIFDNPELWPFLLGERDAAGRMIGEARQR